MRKFRIPIFRIFYSSTYTALLIVALILLAATPADHVYQILTNHKLGNLFVIGATYTTTALLAVFIYASRLYTNRSALAAIPKSYLPIEKGEVPKNVRRMIVKNRQRSAMIAWESRPRNLAHDAQQQQKLLLADSEQHSRPGTGKSKNSQSAPTTICPILPFSPPWGHVAHPGWSSPCTPEPGMADIEFSTVVSELPNLIEAKAVSLAPADNTFDFMSSFHDAVPPPPDPQVVAYLQRPPATGLREYMGHLDNLGITPSTDLCTEFLAQYEYARFADEPLTERRFRKLMHVFSRLLEGMDVLDHDVVARAQSRSVGARSSEASSGSIRSARTEQVTSDRASVISASSGESSASVLHHDVSGVWRPP